jgi:hypothetical protein
MQAKESCADIELCLRLRLGNSLVQTEGFTSARANESFARARDLAVALDRPDEHIQACSGMASVLNAAARYGEAISMVERFGPAELTRMKPMGRVIRMARIGYPKFRRGEFVEAGNTLAEARRELENMRLEDRQPLAGVDPLVAVLMWLSMNLTCQGLLSSADACAREGLGVAEQRQHSNSRVWALYQTGVMSGLKADWADAITRLSQAHELAERYGLKAYGALAKAGHGQALVATGQQDNGTRLLREGYSGWTTFGGRQATTALAAEAAEALLDAERGDEATEFMLAGEKTQRETEEKFQAARLFCLRGRLGELDGDAAAAQILYRHAIAIAEQQGALLFSLQATTACARLCQREGRVHEADAVLRPIYERFTEGFDYPDLVHARSLLDGHACN